MDRQDFVHDGLRFSATSSGTGQIFVFQHGLCGTAAQPAEVFPQGIGWRCVTLESRGHGQSELGDPGALSLARFADDLARFIQSLGKAPVMIGGISMGAAIALRLAVRRPELVRGLVLARPAWLDRPAPANLAPNRVVARCMSSRTPAEARARFEASPTAKRLRREGPDNLASLTGFFDRVPLAQTRALLAAIAADGTGVSRDEIAAIACRTLVIGHARDPIHPLAMAKEIATLIPHALLAEITPKADSAEGYRSEFQHALRHFLSESGQ